MGIGAKILRGSPDWGHAEMSEEWYAGWRRDSKEADAERKRRRSLHGRPIEVGQTVDGERVTAVNRLLDYYVVSES